MREVRCALCGGNVLMPADMPVFEGCFSAGDRRWLKNAPYKNIRRVVCEKCGNIQFENSYTYNTYMEYEVWNNYDEVDTWSFEADRTVSFEKNLTDKLSTGMSFSSTGKVLDIGCGVGKFLDELKMRYPHHIMCGMDIGGQFRVAIEAKGYEFYDSLDCISDQKFTFISVNRVLSVADNPDEILRFICQHLEEDGYALITEINYEINPYMAYCIDARSLFSKDYLKTILQDRYAFEVIDDVLNDTKECGLILRKKTRCIDKMMCPSMIQRQVDLIERNKAIINDAIGVVRQEIDSFEGRIGVYGTSIAGLWAYGLITMLSKETTKKDIFFVEEADVKTPVDGVDILHPNEICFESICFLPFPKYVELMILEKCKKNGWMKKCKMILL